MTLVVKFTLFETEPAPKGGQTASPSRVRKLLDKKYIYDYSKAKQLIVKVWAVIYNYKVNKLTLYRRLCFIKPARENRLEALKHYGHGLLLPVIQLSLLLLPVSLHFQHSNKIIAKMIFFFKKSLKTSVLHGDVCLPVWLHSLDKIDHFWETDE